MTGVLVGLVVGFIAIGVGIAVATAKDIRRGSACVPVREEDRADD